MKLIPLLAAAALAGGMIGKSSATVTLLFNQPFAGGMSSNLANRNGVVTNGMAYGIIVDSSGNGFSAFYDWNHSWDLNSVINLTTAGGLVTTDDVLYVAGDRTSDSSAGGLLLEGDNLTPGGPGGVTSINGLAFSGAVGAGDKFILVWSDGLGFDFEVGFLGTLSDPSFVLPADGSTSNFDAPFVGVDPIRAVVPESSSALLGLLGAAALLKRRR